VILSRRAHLLLNESTSSIYITAKRLSKEFGVGTGNRPLKAALRVCRYCGKLVTVACLCGGVACAHLKEVDLPSANAVGQLVNVATTTSVTSTSFGANMNLPVFIAVDSVTEEEHQVLMVKQTPDYGDHTNGPAGPTFFIANAPVKRT
jgi:hypothetical protein